MTGIIFGYLIVAQRDYMNSRRFTGTIRSIEFKPYATLTLVVPGIKRPLVTTARGIALFQDTALKKAALDTIKREFLGKEFVVIISQVGKSLLQDSSWTDKDVRFPGQLVGKGLLYARKDCLVDPFIVQMPKKSHEGFYRLSPSEQKKILTRTKILLKQGSRTKH